MARKPKAKEEQFNDEDENPFESKKVSNEDEGSIEHRARKKEAQKYKETKTNQPAVKDEYYYFKAGMTFNPKKGRKLIHVLVTKNGSTTNYVGYEKQIPVGFLKRIKSEGKLRQQADIE